jgi:hypothetical protein
MTVDGVACGAGILPGDATRLRTLLEKAGLIDDQHTARLVAEMVDDIIAQIIAHRVSVPDGSIQQALHALCPQLAARLGQLPAVLALDAVQQADQVAPGTIAHLQTGEATSDPLMQRVQGLGPSRDGVRFSKCLPRDHAALLSFWREA